MAILLNSSGLPKGTGSLQLRRRLWWMIYRDASGGIVQTSTGATELTKARRVLARAALRNLREIEAELERIANEATAQKTGTGSRSDRPAAREAGPGANRQGSAKAAGAGRKNPRQRGTRKGEAA